MSMEATARTQGIEPKRRRATRVIGTQGSAIEAVVGAGAVVLSILALAGLAAVPCASIAVMATGAALLFEAGAAAVATDADALEGDTGGAILMESIGADSIAGVGAVVLGVLGLIGVEPTVLLPVAALVLGAGLLLSAAGPAAEEDEVAAPAHEDLIRASFAAASGLHVLVGASAVVLGIAGLHRASPVVMTAIATLSIGGAQLLTGAAIGRRAPG